MIRLLLAFFLAALPASVWADDEADFVELRWDRSGTTPVLHATIDWRPALAERLDRDIWDALTGYADKLGNREKGRFWAFAYEPEIARPGATAAAEAVLQHLPDRFVRLYRRVLGGSLVLDGREREAVPDRHLVGAPRRPDHVGTELPLAAPLTDISIGIAIPLAAVPIGIAKSL